MRIGLTGGIGSGKSTVAALWRSSGVRVIDVDAHAREVLDRPGDGVEEAVARFGEPIRANTGGIDRARLARIVFADPAARADLEAIVHGRVDDAVKGAEQEAAVAGERMVVHDSPLLLERHHDAHYTAIIGVLAPREVRIVRVMRDRGRERDYVTAIMDAQVTDLERIRRCDLLISNSGDLAHLEARSQRALEHVRMLAL